MTSATVEGFDANEAREAGENRPLHGRSILVYGMNYAPEFAGVGRYTGEIGEHLANEGATVTVVTTPPHYPGWRVADGYKNSYGRTNLNGVDVIRCPLFLHKTMRGIWRLVAPLTFALTSAPVAIWNILIQRPHTVFLVEPTLLAAPAALLAARLVGARTVLHVQDLEVDAAFAVGHLSGLHVLRRAGAAFEAWCLKRMDKVITISDSMAERLASKSVDLSRLSVVRNWVDLSHIYPLQGKSAYRAELGFDSDDFVVLYSGNIGAKQGLDTLVDAARLLKDVELVKFVIAGEGPVKAELERRSHGLPNVRFLNFQPYARLNEFLALADLHALPQERGAADLVLPSKLGGMLASGKMVVAAADPGTELAEFTQGAALIVPPGDAAALAEAIRRLATLPDNPVRAETAVARAALLSKTEGLTMLIAALGLSQDTRAETVAP